MTSYINKSGGPPNCDYEYHTLHLANTLSDDGGTGSDFTVRLTYPLKDIVSVQVTSCSLYSATAADAVGFVVIDELSSHFNQQATNVVSNTITSTPLGNPLIELPIHINGKNSRMYFEHGENPNCTEFVHPIERISRLTVHFRQCDGSSIPMHNTSEKTFISLKFTCMRQNLCKNLEVNNLKGEDYRGAKPATKKPVRPVIYYYED